MSSVWGRWCTLDIWPAVVSAAVIAVFLVPSAILRKICQRKLSCPVQCHAVDFLAMFTYVGSSTEMGHLMHYYGTGGFVAAVLVVNMTFWFVARLCVVRGTTNPCTYLERYLSGQSTLGLAISLVVAQLAGGILALMLARRFQALEMTDYHFEQARRSGCSCALNVPIVFGCLLEAAGVVLGDVCDETTILSTECLNEILKNLFKITVALYGVFLNIFDLSLFL